MMQIKLLNNEVWLKDNLLKRMDDDSFYYGFLGKNSLSSSSCKDLYKSPKSYFTNTEAVNSNLKPLREGRLIHTVILEEEKINDKYKFIDCSTRRTKKFNDEEKKYKDSDIEVMLTSELNMANNLSNSIKFNNEVNHYFNDGIAESSTIGELFGLPFRGRADYLKGNHLIDLKTTTKLGVNGKDWLYAAKNIWHYDMQAYIYSELFSAEKFTFVVIEKGSGDIGCFEVTKKTKELAGNKVKQCVNSYKEYFIDKTSKVDDFTIKGFL